MFKRREKTFEVLKSGLNNLIHLVKTCKKDGNIEYERFARDRIFQVIHIAASMLQAELITHEQYRELSDIQVSFYEEERKQVKWFDEIINKKKLEYAREEYAANVENQMKLFLRIFNFEEDENA